MGRRTWIGLACGLACAAVVSLSGQTRTRDGVVAPRGAPTAQPPSGGGPVRVVVYPQLMHVRFTKAVTATADTREQDVRAHLENPVLATVPGSTQKAVILPSDIDVNLSVLLEPA